MRTATTRTIGGRVGGADGQLVWASEPGVSSSRASVGVYNIRLPPSARLLSASAVVITGGAGIVTMPNYSGNGFGVNVLISNTGASTDLGFFFMAVVAA